MVDQIKQKTSEALLFIQRLTLTLLGLGFLASAAVTINIGLRRPIKPEQYLVIVSGACALAVGFWLLYFALMKVGKAKPFKAGQ
jgi:uncharacterized membrane protein HdeD (DUF308 family)